TTLGEIVVVRGIWPRRLSARVDDDREILHRRLDQFLRPVARGGIEEQRVSWFQKIGPVGMPLAHLARKHIDELDARVAEIGIRLAVALEGYQKRLDADLTSQRMAEQIVEVAGLGAAAFDAYALPGFDKRAIAPLFGFGKQVAHRDIQRLGEGAQRRQRRR